MTLPTRMQFRWWRVGGLALLALTGSHLVCACEPSYSNQISNDDMYVYGTTTVTNPGGYEVEANETYVTSPSGRSSFAFATQPSFGTSTVSTALAIAGEPGTYFDNGNVSDSQTGQTYTPVQVQTTVQPPYVQITTNSMSLNQISISGTNGPSCGTDAVTVYVFRAGNPFPNSLTINFAQSAGSGSVTTPNGENVVITPVTGSPARASDSVCAKSAGTAIVRAQIMGVSAPYTVTAPNPAGSADSQQFQVAP